MTLLDPVTSDPAFRWDRGAARHLLNRAGFGVPPASVDRLASVSPAEAVAAFVDYESQPDRDDKPTWLPPELDYAEMRQARQSVPEDQRRALQQERQRQDRRILSKLQLWWVERMCQTRRPLEEKMTLFWHGHFATSAEKVQQPAHNYELNDIFRRHATGHFPALVTKTGQSAAMLRYLDNVQNVRGKPNENWARELFELFTLGIGHYTEDDIKQAARAFTGWGLRGGEFHFNPRRHDDGTKTVFGKTGRWKGEDIVRMTCERPECAEFICRKLWVYFAYEEPEDEIVKGLAATFRQSGMQIKPVLRQMFLSRAFYSEKARATQIKSPAQLVVNLLIHLETDVADDPPILQLGMRAMGQSLFYPPNVKGWDGGRAWINTNTLLLRCNFANYLVSGVVPDFGTGRAGGGAGQLRRMMRDNPRPEGDRGSMEGMMAMDDSSMMMGAPMMDDAGDDAPAGQDATSRDNPSRTFTAALEQRRASQAETRVMERAPFRAREFFARYHGMTAEEIVDAMTEYFVGFPLDPQQRERLIHALAQGVERGRPVPVTRMAEEDLRATVQLLLSTAEYQVC